ncbi:hypothetical protein JD844_007141 [Phrynosoma platyrhinos]|uniref:MHC class I antigen n=1 Tax=Phrynosoma platyrhinos TaxID=52577 RepID=A0ABQ7T313_PHRPL|nr:hypothetical protein JD844_007141 [Phrynosoma platyrhinos]
MDSNASLDTSVYYRCTCEKDRKGNSKEYLSNVRIWIADPLDVYCTAECQLSANGTNNFYEVLLNKVEFLRFHAAKNHWEPLQETPAAIYASTNLNKYNETSTDLQFFLQETCINFIREHTDVKGALTGKHEGRSRSHTPLVLGISIGALAVMGLAVCIFLCTGGKR